jgi:two-component system NtrC family sensor kinase
MSDLDKSECKETEGKVYLGETKIPRVQDKGVAKDQEEKVKLGKDPYGDDLLTEMESIFDKVRSAQPRLESEEKTPSSEEPARLRRDDLEALLDINKAINSTLVLDDILQMVMKRAIKLLRAERGFLMLLDDEGRLQFKTAHNIRKDSLSKEDFRISMSIASRVAEAGRSIYTSDAQHDERYSKQKSILELDLKSIMCVPLKSKEKIIGILYLDNSSKSNIFLQSDLYLFELFAGQAAIAIENAKLYGNLLSMKIYNENVVNKTPIGIVVVDNSLKITIANHASREILKTAGWKSEYEEGSFKGLSLLEVVPPEEKNRWKKICYQVLYSGEPFEEAKSYHKLDSEEVCLSLKISPLNSHDNRAMGLIMVIEDTTEKVIAERYRVLSEKLVAKGEMAASIGHELNNYLTIILNNAELLPLNLKKGNLDKVEKNTQAIQESVDSMKRFTDGLMDFSKLESQMVEYDLRTVMQELLFYLKPQKQFSSVKFVTRFDPGLPILLMDVGQIKQVFLNLFNNAAEAINASPERKGTITIIADYLEKEGQAEVQIKDTGPGIPPENLEKIFEPRFTTKKNGHGLGLFTCERLIRNHQGKISVESTPGQGTTFTITLPIKKFDGSRREGLSLGLVGVEAKKTVF